MKQQLPGDAFLSAAVARQQLLTFAVCSPTVIACTSGNNARFLLKVCPSVAPTNAAMSSALVCLEQRTERGVKSSRQTLLSAQGAQPPEPILKFAGQPQAAKRTGHRAQNAQAREDSRRIERCCPRLGAVYGGVAIGGKQLAMPGGGLANSVLRNPVYPSPPPCRRP